jgi:hypothetical protein
MKNIKMLFLLLTAVGWVNIGFGQTCSPVICNTSGLTINDMLCGTYATMNWDWESTDCKNWFYNANGIELLPHPFCSTSQSGRVKQISDLGDYKKENGWVLIKREFGCYAALNNTGKKFPYFILYNKYAGLLRMFVNAPSLSSETVKYNYIFKLSAVNRATSITSPNPCKTPDKYLASSVTDDAIFYYHPETKGGSWIVGEFNLNFDPNIANLVYNQSQIKIELLLATSQDIKATIKGTTTAYSESDINGINFSSSKNDEGKFQAKGDKIISFATKGNDGLVKLNKGIENSADKMDEWSETLPGLNPFKYKLRGLTALTDPNNGGIGKPIAKFFDLTKKVGESVGMFGDALNAIDAIGDFTGWWNLFSSNTSGPAVTPPTTTIYDLSFEGKISATQLQTEATFTVPGINNQVNVTNYYSYYNSPLGIFNLQTSPTAKKVVYDRYIGVDQQTNYSCTGSNTKETRSAKKMQYQSVKMDDNVIPVINNCSELKLESMNVALFIKFDSDPLIPSKVTSNRGDKDWCGAYTYNYSSEFNHFLGQINTNCLEIVKYDREQNIYIFRTKYVDYKGLKDLAVNAPNNAKVTLNVIAAFSKTGVNEPFVISKEFSIDFTEVPSPVNRDIYCMPIYDQIKNFIAPFPFSNGEVIPAFVSDGNLTPDYSNIWSGYYNLTDNINLVSNLTVSYISLLTNRTLMAANSITVNSGVSLGLNTVLTIGTGYQDPFVNTSVFSQYSSLACNSYSSNAYRINSNQDLTNYNETVIIAPNPFQDNFKIDLNKYENIIKNVIIFDQMGREVKSFFVSETENELFVDLINSQTGLYLVKIQTSIGSETIKIIKQ